MAVANDDASLEQALAAARGAILEAALDSIIVIDADSIVRELNPAAERTFGYARAEAIGRDMADLIIPARYRDAHRRGVARVLATGDGRLLGRRVELVGMRRDGSEFPVELTVIKTGADAPRLFAGYVRDISQQKASEQSLLERTRHASLSADVGLALTRSGTTRDMLQACAQAVVTRLDAAFARVWTLNVGQQMLELQASAGLYTHLNGAHGRVPVGQFKIGLIAQERRPHLTNHVIGDPRVGDQAWAKREGMVAFAGYPLMIGEDLVGVLAMFARHPLSDADFDGLATVANGIAVGIARQRAVESLRDRADQLAQLAAALERTNRELDQFAYVASHDLKAPLRGIGNLSQWIEEDLGERIDDTAREHLRLLRGRVHRMETLIDGILSYSRAGRGRVAPEPVDVRRLVEEVIELIAAPPDVRFEIQPDLPVLVTGRLPLQQVLMNLISNAVKYNRRPGAVVTVGATRLPDTNEFFVADNGPGIAPAFHDRIWGIFQTLESRDKVEGAGIGLALVKKIVEGRGGRVGLRSAPGEGSTFTFTWREMPVEQNGSADAGANA